MIDNSAQWCRIHPVKNQINWKKTSSFLIKKLKKINLFKTFPQIDIRESYSFFFFFSLRRKNESLNALNEDHFHWLIN